MTFERIDIKPDTDEWLAERRKSFGASEVAAAIGQSTYGGTPLKVYLDKIGAGRDRFDPLLSLIGHGAEPIISDWVAAYRPEIGKIEPGFMARSVEYPWLHATFDRVVLTPEGVRVPLQLKTSSVYVRHKWELDTPVDYRIQEDVECLVMGAPFAYLAVWHTGTTDFELRKLHADAERQQVIIERTRELAECVRTRTPPPFHIGDDLAALYPAVADKTVVATDEILDVIEFKRETAAMRIQTEREFKAQEAEATFELEKFMKDATIIINPYTGREEHTWKETKSGVRRHYTPKGAKN